MAMRVPVSVFVWINASAIWRRVDKIKDILCALKLNNPPFFLLAQPKQAFFGFYVCSTARGAHSRIQTQTETILGQMPFIHIDMYVFVYILRDIIK